jgi:probable HAF family extracellular repeat protein
MKDLGTLGGSWSRGFSISDSKQVTGESSITGDTTWHAFLYSARKGMKDLGTLGGSTSGGYGINSFGQVTGYSDIAGNATYHAFLYSAGHMRDLNDLLPSSSGWTLMQGWGINDLGQITGYGTINGQYHAFLMTPVH